MAIKSYLHLQAKDGFPVGIRRNNPGNLRRGKNVGYPGVTDRPDTGRGPQFYAFENMAFGMRAMIVLVLSYIVKGQFNTITKLAHKYAPPNENNTAQWIAQVSKRASLSATAPLTADKDTVKRLVMAIALKEVGSPWRKAGVVASITPDDFEDGWALLAAPPVA